MGYAVYREVAESDGRGDDNKDELQEFQASGTEDLSAKVLPEAKRWQLVAFGFLMARIAGYLEPTVKSASMGLWQITITHPLALADWRAVGLIICLLTIALVAYIAHDITQWFSTELRRHR